MTNTQTRNVLLWWALVIFGLFTLIASFRGKSGSMLAALLAPANVNPNSQPASGGGGSPQSGGGGNSSGTVQAGASAAGTGIAAGFDAATGNTFSTLGKLLQGLKDLPSTVAQDIAAVEKNPQATSQAASTGFWQGLLRALGL